MPIQSIHNWNIEMKIKKNKSLEGTCIEVFGNGNSNMTLLQQIVNIRQNFLTFCYTD